MLIIGKVLIVGWLTLFVLLQLSKAFEAEPGERHDWTAIDYAGAGVVSVMIVTAFVGAFVWMREAYAS